MTSIVKKIDPHPHDQESAFLKHPKRLRTKRRVFKHLTSRVDLKHLETSWKQPLTESVQFQVSSSRISWIFLPVIEPPIWPTSIKSFPNFPGEHYVTIQQLFEITTLQLIVWTSSRKGINAHDFYEVLSDLVSPLPSQTTRATLDVNSTMKIDHFGPFNRQLSNSQKFCVFSTKKGDKMWQNVSWSRGRECGSHGGMSGACQIPRMAIVTT